MRPHRFVARDRPKRLTRTISSVSLGWPCVVVTNSGHLVTSLAVVPDTPSARLLTGWRAVVGRSDVNICQHLDGALARNRSAGIHPGIHDMGSSSRQCRAWLAQRFTHDRHAVGVRDCAVVRSQVRAAGTHSGVRVTSQRGTDSINVFLLEWAPRDANRCQKL